MNKRQAKKKIKKTIEKGWYRMTSRGLFNLYVSIARINKKKKKSPWLKN